MDDTVTLRVEQTDGARGTRRVLKTSSGGGPVLPDLWIELTGLEAPGSAPLDEFVFGVLLRLMELGRPVVIEGAMTRTGYQNAVEIMDLWALWRPGRYRKVAVRPLELVDGRARDRRGVLAAFSGGVDSTFTVLRHTGRLLGEASRDIGAVVMVQGFDVPVDAQADFDNLVARVRPLLDGLGLPPLVVRTNLKAGSGQHWEDTFAPQLAACLHQLSHAYAVGLIASSNPYDALLTPWGSTPISDHLCSGDELAIVHDGAGFSRTDKVALIAGSREAAATVKVCWEGPVPYENCGRCEKCIRTRLNFLAVGVEHPPCFRELCLRLLCGTSDKGRSGVSI